MPVSLAVPQHCALSGCVLGLGERTVSEALDSPVREEGVFVAATRPRLGHPDAVPRTRAAEASRRRQPRAPKRFPGGHAVGLREPHEGGVHQLKIRRVMR